MLVKGLTNWINYGYHKKFRIYYCVEEKYYTPLTWERYLKHKIEYIYHDCIVRQYTIDNTQEALDKFYSLIKEFAPNYNLKKLQHEMRLKLIKNI